MSIRCRRRGKSQGNVSEFFFGGPKSMREQRWKLRFLFIWTGQTVSLFGSNLVSFALTWWLTKETGSAAVLATSSFVALLPEIVLGPFVGSLIDRWSRRRIMIVADSLIALATAVLAILFLQGSVELWHVYAILLLRSLGGAFHDPAMVAATSLLVPPEELARVGGLNSMRRGANRIAGPPLGALLLAAGPIGGILAFDVVTALFAVVPLFFLEIPEPERRPGTQAASPAEQLRQIWADTSAGFRYIRRWKALFVVIVSMSVVGFFVVPTNRLAPLVISEHFDLGADALALHSAVIGAGVIGGGLLMSGWGGFRRRFDTMLLGLLGFGLFGIVRGIAPSNAFWLWIGASFLRNVFNEMTFVPMEAILQSAVPPEMQGRVFAARNSLFMGVGPLGFLILGPLADVVGPLPLITLSGVVVLLLLVYFRLTPGVWALEEGPAAPAAGSVPVAPPAQS
jgi:DHA3 family macrolide efflux protein-like MFS transporter